MSPASSRSAPRRIVGRAVLLGTSALLAAGVLATWQPAPATGWNQGSAEGTLWQLLNGARANNGLAPLQQHGTLVSLARWRSQDMLQRDYFSHTIPGGCDVYCSYNSSGLPWTLGGENIGWNSGRTDAESPVRVHEQFMGSPGHRANVLNRAFTHGGVGASAADNAVFQGAVQNTRMYTELFMQSGAAAPASQPASAPSAPRPPSGGGGGAAAPAAPAPAAPVATPEPQPMTVAMAVPPRPVSTAGIDGTAMPVVRRPSMDEVEALEAVDSGEATPRAMAHRAKAVSDDGSSMEVTVAEDAEAGLLASVVAAVLSFLGG